MCNSQMQHKMRSPFESCQKAWAATDQNPWEGWEGCDWDPGDESTHLSSFSLTDASPCWSCAEFRSVPLVVWVLPGVMIHGFVTSCTRDWKLLPNLLVHRRWWQFVDLVRLLLVSPARFANGLGHLMSYPCWQSRWWRQARQKSCRLGCLLLTARPDQCWWRLGCDERHHVGVMLRSLEIAWRNDVSAAWVGCTGQPWSIQPHGMQRRLHNIAFLVQKQEILIRDAGAPIVLAVPLMLDEGTEVEGNPCYPCVLDVEF